MKTISFALLIEKKWSRILFGLWLLAALTAAFCAFKLWVNAMGVCLLIMAAICVVYFIVGVTVAIINFMKRRYPYLWWR